MSEGYGENPWAAKPICSVCNDIRRIAPDRFARESIPCPTCGCTCERPPKGQRLVCSCDGGRRHADLIHKRQMDTYPVLKMSDLTEEEVKIVNDWKAQRHHELDCLRWIEGRRYDPTKDEEFLKEAREEFRKWRTR